VLSAAFEAGSAAKGLALRPDRKEDVMSSEISTQNLTDDNMNMLRAVLSDAGYTDDILLKQPRRFNLAAKLMIRLFREGTTVPADFTIQLDRHFGNPKKGGRCLRRFTSSP
jgi:hypothetical protein